MRFQTYEQFTLVMRDMVYFLNKKSIFQTKLISFYETVSQKGWGGGLSIFCFGKRYKDVLKGEFESFTDETMIFSPFLFLSFQLFLFSFKHIFPIKNVFKNKLHKFSQN